VATEQTHAPENAFRRNLKSISPARPDLDGTDLSDTDLTKANLAGVTAGLGVEDTIVPGFSAYCRSL